MTRGKRSLTPYCAADLRQNFWWTCAELNCGLTGFRRGPYTLSRWSILQRGQSIDKLPHLRIPEMPCPRGEMRRTGNVPYFMTPEPRP